MAALEIAAIDQQPANTSGAHVAELDLLDGGGHGPLKRGRGGQAIALSERAGKKPQTLAGGRICQNISEREAIFAETFAETIYPQSPDFALFTLLRSPRSKAGKCEKCLFSQGF
jgi:hypothetical protein